MSFTHILFSEILVLAIHKGGEVCLFSVLLFGKLCHQEWTGKCIESNGGWD